jgi:cytochrome P450
MFGTANWTTIPFSAVESHMLLKAANKPTLPPGPRNRLPLFLIPGRRREPTLKFLPRLAREYGDFVSFKVGPWKYVLVNDPEAIRDVLVTQADKFTKGPALHKSRDTLGNGLLTSEGEFHRKQRRIVQPALHPQRVAGYADAMARIASRTAQQWSDGQEFDVHAEMMTVALRIVAKTLFDADVDSEVDTIGHAMDVVVGMFTRTLNPLGPILNILPLPSNYRFYRARQRLNETIDRFISERRRDGAGARTDLLSVLLRATEEDQIVVQAFQPASGDAKLQAGKPVSQGAAMSDEQLRSELFTLFTAGHETTANALTFAWHCLSRNPEAEARLHEELDQVLGDRLATESDLARLPYARAVLAESMRLYPPAWAIARSTKETVRVAGWEQYELPPRTIMLCSQWVTQRDARWWPEPERFDPGRWLNEGQSDRPRYAYFPFGGGARNCVGEAFAWSEGLLVLATLAQKWRLRLIEDRRLDLVTAITLRPRGEVRMRATRR